MLESTLDLKATAHNTNAVMKVSRDLRSSVAISCCIRILNPQLTDDLVERGFEVAGRLTPAIGLLESVKVSTTFAAAGPFKWVHGETLDFDADIPDLRNEETQ